MCRVLLLLCIGCVGAPDPAKPKRTPAPVGDTVEATPVSENPLPPPVVSLQSAPSPMGVPACDRLLERVNACGALAPQPKAYIRALWDEWNAKLQSGVARVEIERDCSAQTASWNVLLREHPGC